MRLAVDELEPGMRIKHPYLGYAIVKGKEPIFGMVRLFTSIGVFDTYGSMEWDLA